MTNSEESNPKYVYGVGEASPCSVKLQLLRAYYFLSHIYFVNYSFSMEFIKSFQTIIFNFLWKGPDKIAGTAAIIGFEYGGLIVTDLAMSIKSLRLSWIRRLLSEDCDPWKAYFLHLLKPFRGDFLLYCDYNINDYNFSSIFYKEMLQWWSDFRSKFDVVSPFRECIIWNNGKTRVNGKPKYYHNYKCSNIVLLSD